MSFLSIETMRLTLLLVRIKKLFQTFKSPQLKKALLSYRVLAGTEHRKLIKNKKFATIIDVGANRGQFALAARNWAQQAQISSFEPLAEAARIFNKLFQEDEKTNLFQAAISPKSGESMLHIAAADDSSSLLHISPLQEQLFPGTGEVRIEKVRTGPLSDFIRAEQIHSPALLKIDVQGYELETLRGCESLLNQFDFVYVECSFIELYVGQPLVDEVIAWLRDKKWRLSGIHNMQYDNRGKSIQADFLFEKETG